MAAVTLLSTHGLSREFGGLHAVEQIDFELAAGEIRAIIGPNGAGKTTFVGLISGRIIASAGNVIFCGEDITRLPAHERVARGIAYTFQITSVFGRLSAFDNVALAVQSSMQRTSGWRPLNASELASRSRDALERVGLGLYGESKASQLAYGHQRLLEVAMGLALQPKLLILDEPTQGLSDSDIEAFCVLICSIVAATTTVLLIEHNMDVVMRLAHRITVMDQGRILAEGSPQEIRENVAVQRAYLGA